jgi:protein-tyrosine phosphatase
MEDAQLSRLLDIIDKPYYNEIWVNLFLGSIDTFEGDPAFTATLGAVVSLVCPDYDSTTEEAISAFLPPDCDHMYIAISDSHSANIGAYFKPCYAFVAKHLLKNHRVLVHCVEGRSRSATMVCYIVARENPRMSIEEVVTHVKTQRCIVRPNTEFLRQFIAAYNAK